MTREQKKKLIREHAVDMLKDVHKNAIAKVYRAIESGAIDVEGWDEKNKPMILPKSIVCAVLYSEIEQYLSKRTSFEKEVQKNIKNLRCFI